jgi:PleD family two-component response regulator
LIGKIGSARSGAVPVRRVIQEAPARCRYREWAGIMLSTMSEAIATEGIHAVNVLLVDDEPTLVRALARFLNRAGHAVTTASDGKEAVELISRTAFDVIVSDIEMPGMSGLLNFYHRKAA